MFIFKYGSTLLLAIAPLLTSQYSLLDLLGYKADGGGTLTMRIVPLWSFFVLSGPKSEVEMRLRTILTLVGVFTLVLHGYFDAYLPSRSLKSFRHDYLNEMNRSVWRKKNRLPADIRINVMFFRWSWLPPWRVLEIVWKDGFNPPHDRDASMRLGWFQGVCGAAVKARDAVFVDLRSVPPANASFASKYLWRNEFHMSAWQLKKAQHLKAVLSVPLFERHGAKGKEKDRCVGIINLDSATDDGADHLAMKKKDLAQYLAKYGTLIAKMR